MYSNEEFIQMNNLTLFEVSSWRKKNFKNFLSDKANVIMFICNHCPYVKHINDELVILSKEFIKKGISFIAINSNDIKKYPEDSPENMKKTHLYIGYPFPYFFDETQEVAKYYGVKYTPEFFIFSGFGKLYYNGQFDNSRPGNNIPVTGYDIRYVLEKVHNNINIDYPIIKPSYGCSIKWKTSNYDSKLE